MITLDIARERGLDLVEVAPNARPPVCRIMDYGKFKYEQSQRAKESRKKATHVLVKEMKYRPKIGPGDFDTKTYVITLKLGRFRKVRLSGFKGALKEAWSVPLEKNSKEALLASGPHPSADVCIAKSLPGPLKKDSPEQYVFHQNIIVY